MQSRDYIIYMGIKQKLYYDFAIEIMFTKVGFKYFNTTTKRTVGYIEITPFNKGNLTKIRKYHDHYEVWYATRKIAYCTTLLSVYKLITK